MTIQVGDAAANPVFTDVVQQTQSLGSLNATNSVQLRGQATATVQVTGIGSMTLTFEGSTDGSNFDPVFAAPIGGGTPVTTTTANGHWVNLNVTGLFVFRVRVSAYTSGTATVSVIASQGAPSQPNSAGGYPQVGVAQWGGTTLGTPTNFGTTPGAVVAGSDNASIFVGTTAVRSNQTTTATGVVDTNLAGIVGTTAVTSAAGVQKVGISGATAVALDGTAAAGTSPTNGLLVLAENVTTAPSLTTGQSVALQCDYEGSVFVKPYRRGQTVAKATTISSTTATTIVTAPGAGIFADLSSLVITVTPQASTGESFTVTVSDGTNSYIYDLFTGVTATLAPTSIQMTFDPPIPATTAATAWTATASSVTTQPTYHVTTVAVLQKAS
jgi:hypothetical protein